MSCNVFDSTALCNSKVDLLSLGFKLSDLQVFRFNWSSSLHIRVIYKFTKWIYSKQSVPPLTRMEYICMRTPGFLNIYRSRNTLSNLIHPEIIIFFYSFSSMYNSKCLIMVELSTRNPCRLQNTGKRTLIKFTYYAKTTCLWCLRKTK